MAFCKAKKISDHCGRFVRGKTLDFGAGRCLIAKKLKEQFNANIECLDVDDLNETDMKLIVYDGKKIPFKNNTFDTVLIVYVLHHCPDPEESLKEIRRVCKKNGRVIVFEDFGFTVFVKAMDILVNKLHGVKTPLHFKKRDEWMKIFSKLDMELERMENKVEKQIFYPFVEHSMFVLRVRKK